MVMLSLKIPECVTSQPNLLTSRDELEQRHCSKCSEGLDAAYARSLDSSRVRIRKQTQPENLLFYEQPLLSFSCPSEAAPTSTLRHPASAGAAGALQGLRLNCQHLEACTHCARSIVHRRTDQLLCPGSSHPAGHLQTEPTLPRACFSCFDSNPSSKLRVCV